MTPEDFCKRFSTPSNACRPQPLWVWNGDMTRERITEMLEQFKDRGVGGVFIHPRPGLITDYLSDEWFELWGFALEECRRLDLECHIYDENSFPSGFAGGHVVASNPHLVGTRLRVRPETDEGAPPKPEGTQLLGTVSVHQQPLGGEKLRFEIVTQAASWWKAGFGYVDLLRSEVTDRFLEVTHDAYARRFGASFGKELRFAFADEPVVCGGGWPMSLRLLEQFRQQRGYDLLDHLKDLVEDSATARATRFDYWLTVHEMFVSGYLKPSHDWCERHGIAFTGHFHESSWPHPKNQPSTMASLRWMQAPGNDLLGFQSKTTNLDDNGIYFLNLKELSSIARQCGREEILTESTGGGGYEFSLHDFKPIEDTLLAMGVNLINPHLSHESLAGARKWDWPQTLSDHSPWWNEYRLQADHIARVNAVLREGEAEARILVLHPDSTGWIHATAPVQGREPGDEDVMESLRTQQITTLLALHRAGFEFDLGDELTLQEMGRVQDGKLIVGCAAYDAVIIPEAMQNAFDSTIELLTDWVAAGGCLVAHRETLRFIDGRDPETDPWDLLSRSGNSLRRVDSIEDMLEQVRSSVAPTLTPAAGASLPENLLWRRVRCDNGSAWFFCNPFDSPLDATLHLGNGRLAELDSRKASCLRIVRGDEMKLSLPARGHALFVPEQLAACLPPEEPVGTGSIVASRLHLERVEREGDNVLFLDYVDLRVGDKLYQGINTAHADTRNWKLQGLPQNPWRVSIQYRKSFLEWPFGERSGFDVVYRFDVSEEVEATTLRGLRLAVERPWLYQIEVNGVRIDSSNGEPWFDEHMRALPIGPHLRNGSNEVRLACQPMHILAEIMPAYLLGDFSLISSAKGFTVCPPRALQLGDWTQQGAPFLAGRLRYVWELELDEPCHALRIHPGSWDGSVACIRVAGTRRAVLTAPGEETILSCELEAGRHELVIEICGNLKNQMGPHFCDGLPGGWSWELCPESTPPGGHYRFYPSGLGGDGSVQALTK